MVEWQRLRRYGYRAVGPLMDLWFERIRGVRTSKTVPLEHLGLGDENRTLYVPSSWLTMRRLATVIPFDEDDVFIDFGSGMGRMVYLAARYPFRRVIGVEIADELNEVARQNIAASRDRLRCAEVELVTCAAEHYTIPLDVTVAYFFSPFTGDVFEQVMDHLRPIYENSRSRQRWVVHQRPRSSPDQARYDRCAVQLETAPWLEVVKTLRTGSSTTVVLRSVGSSETDLRASPAGGT